MPDLLAGLPPRASTPVPGLWLLPCPETLSVYVFGVKEDDAEGGNNANGNGNGNGNSKEDAAEVDTKAKDGELKTQPQPQLAIPGTSRSPSTVLSPMPNDKATSLSPATSTTAAAAAAPPTPTTTTLPAHPPTAAALAPLRADPLERAWAALNSGVSEAEVRALFGSPCAVVVPGARRELWVFSAQEVPLPERCVGE